MLCPWVFAWPLALVSGVLASRTSSLARPSFPASDTSELLPSIRPRSHGAFVVPDSSCRSSDKTLSLVPAGVRSPRARHKSSAPRDARSSCSAASQLRGGSWGPGHSPPFSPQLLHAAEKAKDRTQVAGKLYSCADPVTSPPSQLPSTNLHVFEDVDMHESQASSSEEAEDSGLSVNNRGNGGGGGGGGVGGLPTFPRLNRVVHAKKFSWVP